MGQLRELPEDQKNAALDWLESLPNHPEIGTEVKRLLKKAHPQISYPELDVEDRFTAKVREQEERVSQFISAQKEKENKEYWAKKTKAAINDGLVKEEEVKEFHEWMVGEHLGNYERAAKMWHDEKHAAAEPTNYQELTGIQLPSNEGLFANPIKFGRDEAMRAVNDIRRGR